LEENIMADINITIQKYDPYTDAAPYTVTYAVPWKEHLTVLEALHYVNENCEPVVWDYSCRTGLCGRCGVMVDGKAGLACFTPLTEEDHTIEPLAGYPVIRDLMVDKQAFLDSLTALNLSVKTTGSLDNADLPAIDYEFWWETLDRIQMCRECGSCMTACPVSAADPAGFAGPAALTQVALRMFDEVDLTDRALQAYDMGIHQCIECGMCETVCPSHIAHASVHAQMKAVCDAKGYTAA
jgi:succinate dehydrogenase/fumarate reductase iron-sulfur protein